MTKQPKLSRRPPLPNLRSFLCLALASTSVTALGGCAESEPLRPLSAGANGWVYASSQHQNLVLHSSKQGVATATFIENWLNKDTQEMRWVSQWGPDMPWCALVTANRYVNWDHADAGAKPVPRLQCLSLTGELLPAVDLPLDYTHAKIDPSGRTVVLLHGRGGNPSQEDSLYQSGVIPVGSAVPTQGQLFNKRLSTVVDLASGQARTLTIKGFGGAIEGLRFPSLPEGQSELEVEGKGRRLAVYLGEGELSLIDLNEAALSQVSVRLGEEHSDRALRLRAIAATASGGEAALLVNAKGKDIDYLRLKARSGNPDALDVDYSVLSARRKTLALEALEIEGERWLASANYLGLDLINPKTSSEISLDKVGAVDHLMRYQDSSGHEMLLVWKGGDSKVMTIDPTKALTSLGREPVVHKLGASLSKIVKLKGARIAVEQRNAVTILNLEDGSQTPLAGTGPESGLLYPGGDYLYTLIPYRDASGGGRGFGLARINLNTMVSESYFPENTYFSAGSLLALEGGASIALRIYDAEEGLYGISLMKSDAASIQEMSATTFEGGQED